MISPKFLNFVGSVIFKIFFKYKLTINLVISSIEIFLSGSSKINPLVNCISPAILLKVLLTKSAFSLGFDAVGACSPFVSQHLEAYRQMVETSSYGDMGYLARHLPFKENPELLLPGVRSAYVVIKNYKNRLS